MLQDFFNHVGRVNETDDAHFSLTFRANERVSFVDLPDEIAARLSNP
jgi:hypothetical protein